MQNDSESRSKTSLLATLKEFRLLAVTIAVLVLVGLLGLKAYAWSKKADVLSGQLSASQVEMLEADLKIGKLQSKIVSYGELKKQAQDRLDETREKWLEDIKQYGARISGMSRTIARLRTELKSARGEGGATVNKPELRDRLRELQVEGLKIAWDYTDGRVAIHTDDVLASPPYAAYSLSQIFKYDLLIAENREGLQLAYARLVELDQDGTVLAKADIEDGTFTFAPRERAWYEHIILGADVGVDVDESRNINVPVRGKVGYRSFGKIPWRVHVEPWAEIGDGFKLGYGIGGYGGLEY